MVMTLEQPLDQRLFDSKYDDVEVLGELVTRGEYWWPIGFVLHVHIGAIFGVAYARLRPSLSGPPVAATCSMRPTCRNSPPTAEPSARRRSDTRCSASSLRFLEDALNARSG